MKKSMIPLLIAAVLMVAGLSACEKAAETRTVEQASSAPSSEQPSAQTAATPAANANAWAGKVVETMDAGGYTYVLVDTGSETIWAAGPVTPISVGQELAIDKGMMMKDFNSKALDRSFDTIYFVGSFKGVDGAPAAGSTDASPHGNMGGMGAMGDPGAMVDASSHTTVGAAEVQNIAKAEGGFTVAELFSMKTGLGGQTVKLRGQVVKFTPNIMGTNWVHIQDGTQGDLTVTTDDVVAVGDIVLVEGPLTLDKDFGAGYRYDAIIEGAKVTKE